MSCGDLVRSPIGSGRSAVTLVVRPVQLCFVLKPFWSQYRHVTRGGASPSDLRRESRMATAPGVLRAWLLLPAGVRGRLTTSGLRLEHPEEWCHLSEAGNGLRELADQVRGDTLATDSAELEGMLRDFLLEGLLARRYRLHRFRGGVPHRQCGGGDGAGCYGARRSRRRWQQQ